MTVVHEVMTSAPITVTPATSVTELLRLFDRHDYNAFPVLEPEGQLVGVVSKLDILRLFVTDASDGWTGKEALRAADVMQREVVSAEAEGNLVDAGKLMIETKLRSVPVVHTRPDGPRVVGMLSRSDVLRALRFLLHRGPAGAGESELEAIPGTDQDRAREAVETLVDQIGDQSFPASDPPAWGVVGVRLHQALENGRSHPPATESAEQ